ncbi:MAG TPA: rhomboid family intramembrane serine protease [Bacteroidales bacterium]|nr:rhomboid family intramembrane serine protease [Bacteroidales bacterium]
MTKLENQPEAKQIKRSLFIAFSLVFLVWLTKLLEISFQLDLTFLGIRPLTIPGLLGIITTPFVHSDFKHLFSNTAPLFFLTWILFELYKGEALKILIANWLLTGALTWLMGRDSVHIGASGIVYSLAAFHFTSGIIKKNPRLMTLSLLIIFLYGGLVWGIFPQFFPNENISWESHLGGFMSGTLMAFAFKSAGPQSVSYFQDESDDDDSDIPWNRPE